MKVGFVYYKLPLLTNTHKKKFQAHLSTAKLTKSPRHLKMNSKWRGGPRPFKICSSCISLSFPAVGYHTNLHYLIFHTALNAPLLLFSIRCLLSYFIISKWVTRCRLSSLTFDGLAYLQLLDLPTSFSPSKSLISLHSLQVLILPHCMVWTQDIST